MSEKKPSDNKDQAYAISDIPGTKKLYAGWADEYDKDTTEGMGYVAPIKCAELAAEFLDKGQPLLELACGTGLSGLELHSRGFVQLHGMDLSPEMMAKAKALGIYDSLAEVDMTQPYPVKDESYESLVCCGIFGPSVIGPEHLEHLAAPLKSGGRAVISINGKGLRERPFEDALEKLFDDGLMREIYAGLDDYLIKEDIDALYVVLEKL